MSSWRVVTSTPTYHPIPSVTWTDFKCSVRAQPRLPSVAALMKARVLALIQAEVEECHEPTATWNVLCRLREAVEQMEIPT